MKKEKAVKDIPKKSPKKECVVIEPKQEISVYRQREASVENMIMQAIKEGTPVETLERVLAMRDKLKAEYDKEQYDIAMSGFQSECPIIKRVKEGSKTKSGQLAFKYAPLEVIIKEVQPTLRKYNLSYNFKPIKNEQGKLTDVRCYATHINGYSDFSEMPVTEGGGTSLMSGSQISAASITFAKRYAFCNIFGIVTEEEDNENQLPKDVQSEPAVISRLPIIKQMIKDAGYKEGAIAQKFNAPSIDDMDERTLLILEKSLQEKLGKDYIPIVK
jgi:hypothetical protein